MRKLSDRLYTVSTLVPNGARVADIGTDHGHLPIYLIKNEISPYCIASDIRENPLNNARANIEKTGTKNIDTRLGAGLDTVSPDEVDCVVVAGMGGEVIAEILDDAKWTRNEKYTFIFQPMTSADALRKYLCEKGFFIESETAVEENRKIYTVIKARFSSEVFSADEVFLRIGKLDPACPTARKYIEKQARIVEELLADRKAAGLSTDGYEIVYEKMQSILGDRDKG